MKQPNIIVYTWISSIYISIKHWLSATNVEKQICSDFHLFCTPHWLLFRSCATLIYATEIRCHANDSTFRAKECNLLTFLKFTRRACDESNSMQSGFSHVGHLIPTQRSLRESLFESGRSDCFYNTQALLTSSTKYANIQRPYNFSVR